MGTAYSIHEIYVNPETRLLEKNKAPAELERYERFMAAQIAEIAPNLKLLDTA